MEDAMYAFHSILLLQMWALGLHRGRTGGQEERDMHNYLTTQIPVVFQWSVVMVTSGPFAHCLRIGPAVLLQ
jgi:hypothetical protein